MLQTVDFPDDRLAALAVRFDNLAWQAEAAGLSGLPTIHNRFVRAWTTRDLDAMAAQIAALQAALA